jgi:hypothetical protein
VGAQKRIWLAEARAGQIVRLENGRTGSELMLELIESAARASSLVVGLDFAFSFPQWFMDEHMAATAHELWRLAQRDGETWLAACEPPFWGRPGRPRPLGAIERGYRRAEFALSHRPKSVFQIGGSGSVGTGSIRGMPVLLGLHEAGFSIWPFDRPSLPLVLEIYPRLMTGPVVKSNGAQRLQHLIEHHPGLDEQWLETAASTEDAFDAAVSALVMSQHAARLASLPGCLDSVVRREGCIWHPALVPDEVRG